MTQYKDAIFHIENLTLVDLELFSAIAHTPLYINENSALTYVRVSSEELEQWRNTIGITVLGEAEYTGAETPEQVYSIAITNPLYRLVYNPFPNTSEDGTVQEPPLWFGVLG